MTEVENRVARNGSTLRVVHSVVTCPSYFHILFSLRPSETSDFLNVIDRIVKTFIPILQLSTASWPSRENWIYTMNSHENQTSEEQFIGTSLPNNIKNTSSYLWSGCRWAFFRISVITWAFILSSWRPSERIASNARGKEFRERDESNTQSKIISVWNIVT